jgi:hypothetical protein
MQLSWMRKLWGSYWRWWGHLGFDVRVGSVRQLGCSLLTVTKSNNPGSIRMLIHDHNSNCYNLVEESED